MTQSCCSYPKVHYFPVTARLLFLFYYNKWIKEWHCVIFYPFIITFKKQGRSFSEFCYSVAAINSPHFRILNTHTKKNINKKRKNRSVRKMGEPLDRYRASTLETRCTNVSLEKTSPCQITQLHVLSFIHLCGALVVRVLLSEPLL